MNQLLNDRCCPLTVCLTTNTHKAASCFHSVTLHVTQSAADTQRHTQPVIWQDFNTDISPCCWHNWKCMCVCVCVRVCVHVLHLHRLRCLVGRWSDSVSTCSSSLLWHPTRGKTKPERQRQEDEQRWKYTQHRNIFLAWCHFSITRRRTSSFLSHHQTPALCTKCNYKLKVLN